MLNEIFKAYDVRGIYKQNFDEKDAYNIGRAFVYFLKCKGVIVGTDMRISSPSMSKAFMKGVTDQGANAIYIGEVCTDATYFASGFLNKPSVMFTASHNPRQYNGIKFTKADAVPINSDTGLEAMKAIIENSDYDRKKIAKKGNIIKKGILVEYVKHVKKFINCRNPSLPCI